ncbi:MAG: hypothetical protein LC796_12735 [Acidobacteria bacterium]|nr:hypothetical protein [Acidobacteriota bacterium]MCA1610961.1 hypothetical protein [Acidobacteriota bacterium]
MSPVRSSGALACFGRGLRASLSKPYLAVSLWLIQLLLASVLILPVSNSLHDLLDDSPSASRMVANPDLGWWETLLRTHPDLLGNFPDLLTGLLTPEGVTSSKLSGLRGIGAAAVSLGLLAIVLHAFALGGIFGTLREPHGSLVTFGREGMRRFPAFLAFTLAALAAALLAYRWVWLETGLALNERMRELQSERQALAITLARVLLLAFVLSAIKLVADSVRAIWVARPDLPPVSRFFAGIAGALARPVRLFGVLLSAIVTILTLYAIWIVADPSAGGEARFALVPLILTQQVFVFLRSLIKVGYYAGISEALTRTPSPEYSYVAAPSSAAPVAPPAPDDEPPLENPAGAV